jgi:hypothetical protein
MCIANRYRYRTALAVDEWKDVFSAFCNRWSRRPPKRVQRQRQGSARHHQKSGNDVERGVLPRPCPCADVTAFQDALNITTVHPIGNLDARGLLTATVRTPASHPIVLKNSRIVTWRLNFGNFHSLENASPYLCCLNKA